MINGKLGILDAMSLRGFKYPQRLPLFFDVVTEIFGKEQCSVTLNELYVGYVSEKSFPIFINELRQVDSVFSKQHLNELPQVLLSELFALGGRSDETLKSFFEDILYKLGKSIESIEYCVSQGDAYSPLKIGDVSIPNYVQEETKKAVDYAMIDGKPFWFKLLQYPPSVDGL